MSIMDRLTSAAQQQAQARTDHDNAVREQERPSGPPKWAPADWDGRSPIISLDAAYAGTAEPTEPTPATTYVDRAKYKAPTGEMDEATREGWRIQIELAERERVRRELRQISTEARR